MLSLELRVLLFIRETQLRNFILNSINYIKYLPYIPVYMVPRNSLTNPEIILHHKFQKQKCRRSVNNCIQLPHEGEKSTITQVVSHIRAATLSSENLVRAR